MIKQDSLQANNGAVQLSSLKVASKWSNNGASRPEGSRPSQAVASKRPNNESGSSESSMTTKKQQWVICHYGQYMSPLQAIQTMRSVTQPRAGYGQGLATYDEAMWPAARGKLSRPTARGLHYYTHQAGNKGFTLMC